MKINNNTLRNLILTIMLTFVSLVSLPAIYAGFELWSISEDVRHYNAQSVKTDYMTGLIQIEIEQREELKNSSHPIIRFMSTNPSNISAPISVILGIFPLFGFRTISQFLFKKLRKTMI